MSKALAERLAQARAGIEEASLLKAAAAGDGHAFLELARRYQDRLYTFCLRWVGDPAVAEEVAAATLLEAWSGLRVGTVHEPLSLSLLELAVPRCRGVRVYRMRRVPGRREAMGSGAPLKVVSGGTDEEARLARELVMLDEEHRGALLLRELEGLDDAAIGRLLGLPADVAVHRVRRARAIIASTTTPDEDDTP